MDPESQVIQNTEVRTRRQIGRGAILLTLAIVGGLLSRWLILDAPRDWPRWLLIGSLPFGLLSLGVALVGVHHLTGIGSWTTEIGHSFEACVAWWGVSFIAVAFAGAAVAWVIGDWTMLPPAVGAFIAIWLGLYPPWWFWEAPTLRFWRGALGDRLVRILYTILGLGLLAAVVAW